MTVVAKTFREFFTKSFIEEKAYRNFGKKHFEIFYEMANPNHIINQKPVKIDEDDIEFLQQFPHEYWVSAKHARYNMLFKAVHELDKDRKEKHKQEELIEKVKNSIKTGNFRGLEEVVPEEKIKYHQNNVKTGNILSDEKREELAKEIVFYHIKDKTPHIKEPEEVEFSLRSSQKGRQVNRVFHDKKPFLNRLYHKLETTPGDPFHSESGLSGEGKYGFHMGDPKELENKDDTEKLKKSFARSTAGFKFPDEVKSSSLRKGIIDFLNLNSHQVFGDLPKGFKWEKVKNIEDTWTVNSLKDKLEKEGKKIFAGEPNKIERIKEFVNSEIIKKIEKGELRGPAIPDINPQGFPVTLKNGRIVNPPLYLPFKDGVPIVNPSHYFRELKDSDIETENVVGDDGKITKIKKYNPDGSPVYNIPPEKLRGHDKKYVHVDDNEFKKQKHKSLGSFDFNHDSREVRKLLQGSEKHDERKSAIFDNQNKISLNDDGDAVYYEDIIKGILYSLQSGWGGISDEQKELFRKDEEILASLHMLIFTRIQETQLDNDNLLEKKGRIEYAKLQTSTIIQKPIAGFGSRRKKNIGTYSYNAFNTDNTSQQDVVGKKVVGLDNLETRRGKGQRMADTGIDPLSRGEESFTYDLTNMRATIAKLNLNTRKVISVKNKDVDNEKIKKNIESLLISNIQERINMKSDVISLLTNLYEKEGTENPTEAATAQMRSWKDDGYNSPEEIIRQFSRHRLVSKAMGDTPQIIPDANKKEENPNEKQALSFLQSTLDKMKDQGYEEEDIKEKLLPKQGQKYSDFTRQLAKNFDDDAKLLDRIQGEINRRFNLPEPQTLAARSISTPDPKPGEGLKDILNRRRLGQQTQSEPLKQEPTISQQVPFNNENVEEIFKNKDWIKLSHNSGWLKDSHQALLGVKSRLLNHLKTNKDKYNEHELNSAIENVEKSIRGEFI